MTDPPRLIHTAGDAGLALLRTGPDTMRAVMTLTDRNGCSYQIHLAPTELRNLLGDALKLLTADQAEASAWWRRLTAEDP